MLCDVLCYFSNFCYPRSNYHLSNFLYLVVAFYLYLDRTPYLQLRSRLRPTLESQLAVLLPRGSGRVARCAALTPTEGWHAGVQLVAESGR